MEIHIDFEELKKLEASLNATPLVLREELSKAMTEALALTWREVVELTPNKTGTLRRSILPSEVKLSEFGVEGLVGTSLSYAIPVELGTKPHKIVARDGGALSFNWHGHKVAFKSVHHPGTKGAHMFERGLAAVEPQIRAIFEQASARIAERVAGGGA